MLVEPDVDDLSRALTVLGSDPNLRTRLGALGIERAKRFTWRQAAALTVDVYRDVADPEVAEAAR
jgi:glycosyltransferase involved in cell wall biosynthesis